jgi:hypothetical protein
VYPTLKKNTNPFMTQQQKPYGDWIYKQETRIDPAPGAVTQSKPINAPHTKIPPGARFYSFITQKTRV